MAAISETIVREYFELHGFLVCQQRKHTPVGRSAEEDIDFLVLNPRSAASSLPLPGVLNSEALRQVSRAVVVVKGWHTETFGLSVLTHTPELFRFVEPKTLQRAAQFFGADSPPTKLLVLPALPRDPQALEQTVALLRTKGIDSVLPFHTILRDLIDNVEVNRNYRKSDLLQILRILKNYDFFRETQMELFKPSRKRAKPRSREDSPPGRID
jgi:hypothetical protein